MVSRLCCGRSDSIIALAAAYLLELLFVGWSRSSLKMLWEPRTSVRLDVLSILVMLLLPQKHLRYLLLDVYAAPCVIPTCARGTAGSAAG